MTDSVTVTRGTQCCVKSDILAESIICHGHDDNALRKKASLFVIRPYASLADEQKYDSGRYIYMCLCFYVETDTRRGYSNLFSNVS